MKYWTLTMAPMGMESSLSGSKNTVDSVALIDWACYKDLPTELFNLSLIHIYSKTSNRSSGPSLRVSTSIDSHMHSCNIKIKYYFTMVINELTYSDGK